MVERLLELASRHAEAAEVYLEDSESRPIQFQDNELKYIHTKSRRAAGVRVIAGGRLGFASTTDLSAPERLVAHALESAQFGQEARFEFPTADGFPDVAVHDPRVAGFAVQRGIELGRDAIDQILAAFPDVQCGLEIGKWVGRTRLANTCGLDTRQDVTGFECYLHVLRVRPDGALLWIGEGDSSRALAHDFERYVAKVLSDIRRSQTEVEAPTGALPVIFTAKAACLLLQILQMAVNGKVVQKGASPLVGRLGDQVLDDRVTILDDATRPYGDASTPHDGDGMASRRTVVFERGVLRSFLFDLQTAGLMGATTTGNAVRSFAAMPQPDATNLVVEPGGDHLDALLAGIERGLVVDEVIGGGQSNVLAGEFSVNVGLGFLVERGQLCGRVKDCMVAGNVFEIFRRLRGIDRRQETHGAVVTPALCFDAVSVAGAA